MRMTIAATKPDTEIYYIIDPEQPERDGVVISNGTIRYVPFWSYVTRDPVSVLLSNEFLQKLWTQDRSTSEWSDTFFLRSQKIPSSLLRSIDPFLIDVPEEKLSKPPVDNFHSAPQVEKKADNPVRPGGVVRRLRSGRQRAGLAMEPYDPDARDGDNDGIVQEGTAWERPAGTRILDVLGREIRRGRQAGKRPLGVRVVDRDGNDIDYKPTYEGGKPGTIGSTVQRTTPTVKPIGEPAVPTPAKKAAAKKAPKPKRESPLADHGARSLRERGLPSAREQYRAATTPPQSEVPEPNEPNEVERPSARPGFLPDEIPKNAKTRYHGTGDKNVEAILGDGLKTNLPGVDENERKEGVYLTLNIDEALDYGTPEAIFAVLVSDDELDGYDPDTGHSFTTRGIPPSRLRLVTDIEKEKRRMEREQRELAARKRPANWTPPTIDDVDTPDALETFAPDGVLYRFETSDRPDDVRPHVYYFSPDPDYASNYGDRGEVVSELPADFLDIRNPKDRAEMKKAVEESLQSLDKLIESKDPEQQDKYRRARRDVEIALEREDSEEALGQQMAALTLAANAVISPDKPFTPGTGQRMILENLKRDALIDIEGVDMEGNSRYSMAFKRRPNTTRYELPKRERPEETPVFGDIALFPGVTSDSADRPELVKPERPRSPFKPSPPPLSGRAQELADEAEGDFETFMELLDKEGYVVFDYETTGLQDGNIPVQIGAVRIKDGKIVERFNVFTNPQRPLSDWSKENLKDRDGNPLTDEWLAGQTDLAEAHRQLAEFMGDSIIVAHNLPYDGEIIDRMMKDAEIDFKPSGSIDTLMLLRSAVPKGDGETGPERHTLGSLADFFDVDLGDAAHTADADSEAAALVLQRAMKWSKDNDSDPEIFDAAKQKELFDEATKKYNADRKKYEEALKQYQADLADYERAVTRADEPVVETDSPEYRMMHQPSDVGPRAHDLTEDGGEGEWLSDDVYANPDRYTGADKTVVRETMEQLRQARGNPDAKVTIYRWAPEGSSIQDGNWVSLSRTYAEQHGESNAGDVAGSVISLEVPAREVRFAGDDLAEFGWFPEKSDRISKNSGDSPEAPVVDPESVWDIYFPGEAYDRDWLEGQTMEDHRGEIRNRLSYFVSGLSDDDRQKLQDGFGTDDLDEIAERLQERVEENIASFVNDLRKKELHMAVPPEALMTILRERRIRSMFETGTSLGQNDRAVRREVESRLIGVPWETPDELRPIYGFVSGDDEPFALTQGEAARHYGGLVITFKNSKKLRKRTTMTAGDSLDYDLHAVPVEGKVSKERLFAASYHNGSSIVQEALWGVERDVTEEVLGRDYDYPDFGEGGSLNYNEIQIHGGATLDDIEEVVYPPDLDDETREEIIAALDAAGVKHREDW